MIPIAKPTLGQEEIDAVVSVLESGFLASGPNVKAFEKGFSEFLGAKHGIACSSGTSALQVGIEALGIKPGDEIITTPFTFIATANSIIYNRAKPVFCDILEDTYNIDPEKIREKITDKTKAVMVVHIYGQPCDMDTIKELCKEKGLVLIEDAAQAHGATYKGKKAGTIGDLGTFSFYATKNMITGEGGMMVTNDDDVAEKANMIINQGQTGTYDHVIVGYNYRMMEMQAAIGLAQLKKIEDFNEKRKSNAEFLTSELKGIEWIRTPYVHPDTSPVWHQYTIRVASEIRDKLFDYLNANGVGARIYYPTPVHMQTAYKNMGFQEGTCPVSEKAAKEVLSLPVHSNLNKEELENIVNTVKKFRE